MLRLTPPNKTETCMLVFFGFKACQEGSNGHSSSFYGLANARLGIATVAMPSRNHRKELSTTIHEIGHLYGIEDHYGGSFSTTEEKNALLPEDKYSIDCTYGEKHVDKRFCIGCREIIQENVSIFNH